MAIHPFQTLAQQYEPAFVTGVNRVIANGIAANAQTLTEAMTVAVIVLGTLMAFRQIKWADFVMWAIRVTIIAFLMTAAGFNEFIARPAMDTIPTWVAQSVNHTTAVAAGPVQFDLLLSAADHQTAAIYQQATGIENFGYRIEAWVIKGIIYFILLVCFVLYEVARAVMGLLVATVVFILFLALFEATKAVVSGAADIALTLLIFQLLLSIIAQIVIAGDGQIMAAQVADLNAGLDEQLGALWAIAVMFAFGAIFMLAAWPIASRIGRGIDLSAVTGHIGSAARRMGLRLRAVAGTAGRSGGRAVQSARSKLRA